ncbi:folate family ECF transporter S component [Abyssisolibacter fermentans]|uniref:folate family ECF transporter S component n=1 Tax=Abyssisolibacter fermentans TaxID=1766203 RepID=UPI00082A83AE|nr:folate family ECF transporter S component [Abyssisolibacter fermentans]
MNGQVARRKLGYRLFTTKVLVSASILTAISIILSRFLGVIIPIAGLPAQKITFGAIPIAIVGIVFGPIAGILSGIVSDLVGFLINPMGGMYFPGFTVSAALSGAIPGIVYKILKQKKFNFKKINFNIINSLMIIFMAAGVIKGLQLKGLLIFSKGSVYYGGGELSKGYIIAFIALTLAYIVIPAIIKRKYNEEDSLYSIDKILFITTLCYLTISIVLNTFWLSILFNKGFMIFLPTRIIFSFVIIPLNTIVLYTMTKLIKYI